MPQPSACETSMIEMPFWAPVMVNGIAISMCSVNCIAAKLMKSPGDAASMAAPMVS